MLKHLRQSTVLRCFVILAFVFFLLPLSPNDAYAGDSDAEAYLLVGAIFLGAYFLIHLSNKVFDDDSKEQKPVAEKDDKEKVLAERFAKLNTDKNGATYPKGRDTLPVFEW